MKMTNRRNTSIYRLWAPVYDRTINRLFLPGRKRAIEFLALQPGERVLIPGVGTGADLPPLHEGVAAIGIDLSPEMLAKARLKLPACRARIILLLGDAQDLPVAPGLFDAVILNLILSVVPDGKACLQSTLKALKPGGRAVIFDKFLPDKADLSPLRKFFNFFSTVVGTDITRQFGEMYSGSSIVICRDEPGLLQGVYRVLLIRKPLPVSRAGSPEGS